MRSDVTVFVVDDDEAVRESVTAIFRAEGLTVETYGSATAFLQAYHPSRRGCLLVDVRMPEMTGLELYERLARQSAKLPVVVMTGYGDVPTAVRAMKAGALDFIEKPMAPQQLMETIRRALETERESAEDEEYAALVAARLERLTPRERDVLTHLVAGESNKAIARELGISPRTVEIHRARVMEKMQAENLSRLIRMTLSAEESGAHLRQR